MIRLPKIRHTNRPIIGTMPRSSAANASAQRRFKKRISKETTRYGAESDPECGGAAPPRCRRRAQGGNAAARRLRAASPPPSDTQSAPRTPQRHAQRVPPTLEMIEVGRDLRRVLNFILIKIILKEISPVLPRPVELRDDFDIPPLPRPLQLAKEWRPLQTSTLTNLHATLPMTAHARHAARVEAAKLVWKNNRDTRK